MWQKDTGNKLNPSIEKYTVGSDWILDGQMFRYELASSLAHARMLAKIGILSETELADVSRAIRELFLEFGNTITLNVSDEDIHSKLENLLIERIGETGKKIHTGRSRNDQVMVVTRMYERERLISISLEYLDLIDSMIAFARREKGKVLPGYTHTKQAMLITADFWMTAFIEAGLDHLSTFRHVFDLINQNPLGSGSGFGVPIPLDREMTARLLGFARVQQNPMYVQNSRGRFESQIIDALWLAMNDFSRLAADMLMYNMDELLFLETTTAITTGSSIMPQKRNLDVMELVRAKTNTMLALSNQVKSTVSGIHSGYNRDLQETKEPLFHAFDLASGTMEAVAVTLANVSINETAVINGLSQGIFATDIAFEAVGKGMPFRDAYRLAATKIGTIDINEKTIRESIENRVSPGSPRTISMDQLETAVETARSIWQSEKNRNEGILNTLLTGEE
jgi:argininosuccinate lyase